MRLRALLIALTLPVACTPTATTLDERGKQDVAAAVSAVTDSLTEAMNAHDADRILAFFDLGPDFMYVACTDVVFGGEMYGNLTRSLHAQKKGVTYQVTLAGTVVLGPDAAVVSLQSQSSDTLASNPVLTTRALSKGADGKWRIVYQHQSWPGCKAPRPPHPMTATSAEDLQAAADTLG